MKRLAILFALLLATTAALAAISEQYKTPFEAPRRQGVERVTHYDPRIHIARIDSTVYLEPAQASKFEGVGRGGYAPFYARGTARIFSRTTTGFPSASVHIKTKDIESGKVYEGWLVDHDSGYRLSLGTFVTTGFGGVGELRYRTNNYLDPYDTVEVTLEPYYDEDPAPGPLVLVGLMPQPRHYDPAVKQAKMLTSSYTLI